MKHEKINITDDILAEYEEAEVIEMSVYPFRNELYVRIVHIYTGEQAEVRFHHIKSCLFCGSKAFSNMPSIDGIGYLNHAFTLLSSNLTKAYAMTQVLGTQHKVFYFDAEKIFLDDNLLENKRNENPYWALNHQNALAVNVPQKKDYPNFEKLNDNFAEIEGGKVLHLEFNNAQNEFFLRIIHPQNNAQILIRFLGVYAFFYENKQAQTNAQITLQKLTYLEKPFVLQRKEVENETFAFHFTLQTEEQNYFFNAEEVVIN
jgi:hypothetical protein